MITLRTETILNQGIQHHPMCDRFGIFNSDKVCGAEMGTLVPVIAIAFVLYHDICTPITAYLIYLFGCDAYRELRIRECFIDDLVLSLVVFICLLAHILLYIAFILLESIL
mgnify:CR=1 FL=1